MESMRSDNIVIRESMIEDCDHFFIFEKDPEVFEHFSINDDRTLKELKEEFDALRRGIEGPVLLFTIIHNETQKPIGRFIAPIDRRRSHIHIDWVYIAGRDMRNKGYGTEALNLFLDYSFNELELERVGIDFFSYNERVESLYVRNGFVREGVLRHFTRKNGTYIDLVFMSILRDEYCSMRMGDN